MKAKESAGGSRPAGFLRRWSRRKLQARAASGPGSLPEGAGPHSGAERVLTDADMPPLDALEGDASVADFFSPGVSEALRKAALRRIFRSPRFNVLDGLEDYDEDFRGFESLGEVLTADVRHRLEQGAQRAMGEGEAQSTRPPHSVAAEYAERDEPVGGAGSAAAPTADGVERTAGRAGIAGGDRSEPSGEEAEAPHASERGRA